MNTSSQKENNFADFVHLSDKELFEQFDSSPQGLNNQRVFGLQQQYGFNEISTKEEKGIIYQIFIKFSNPLVITLIAVAIISIFLGGKTNAIIIIAMAILSVVLSFVQEHNASRRAKELQAMVKITVTVLRDGQKKEVLLKEIVPGDIVELKAGKMIPADLRIISADDLFINQAALTGESFPARKQLEFPDIKSDSIFDIPNLAFMGSNVVSGLGQGIILKTGKNTEFGKISADLTKATVETAFDKGIKDFTWLMIRLILVLGLFIFVVNALLKGNFTEALLFALAVAIGLAPEMLPMIVTVNLAKGAIDMAKKKVIIKELDSIQNFGAMDVLCIDKTGTLTIDNVTLIKHSDIAGKENEEILRLSYINSTFQAGLENLLDRAVINHHRFEIAQIKKIDEIPFDFFRKVMTVVVQDGQEIKLIAKGAPEEIINRANSYWLNGEIKNINEREKIILNKQYDNLSRDGFRVLAVAFKKVDKKDNYTKDDERELIFSGFIAFLDPPKSTAGQAVNQLEKLGIELKVISGDNQLVSEKICQDVGIQIKGMLAGAEIDKLDDAELEKAVEKTNIFSRITPLQKERLIKILQGNKHIVGFLGDGINDAPALKVADVGISVDNATDIAKETAKIILLEKDLTILSDCVQEGRKTFANVIKYIKMGASSNFGNMLSMAGASVILPFLPMLPTQVLLNNFLYDASQIAIPTDDVDQDYLSTTRPWNIKFIKKFIIYIGPISSIFDFLTFGVMWYVFHASPALFQTGWFVESLTTQILVIHIIRTNKIPFIQSRPSKILLGATIFIVLIGAILPYTSIGKLFGFVPLPALFFIILFGMAIAYLILVQIGKTIFIKKFGYE